MKIRTLLFCLLALAATSLNAQTKYAGGDLSMLTKYEDAKVAYYDINGTKIENGKLSIPIIAKEHLVFQQILEEFAVIDGRFLFFHIF